jgi:hypothetical protein
MLIVARLLTYGCLSPVAEGPFLGRYKAVMAGVLGRMRFGTNPRVETLG